VTGVYRGEAQRSSAYCQEVVIETIVPQLKERRPRTHRLVVGAA
jgi:hypothetical protein